MNADERPWYMRWIFDPAGWLLSLVYALLAWLKWFNFDRRDDTGTP